MITKEIKKFCAEVLFRDYQPYRFRSKNHKCYQSVSNFFPFILNGSIGTRYVFDNAPLLLNRDDEKKSCHLLTFYDPSGNVIFCNEYSCELPLFNFKMSSIFSPAAIEYGSFTHHIKHNSLHENNITYHLRGYTYFSSTSSNHESMCHGNFGGIALDLKNNFVSLAKQRSVFTYTSQIYLDLDRRYNFYWNNPSDKPLDLSMMSNDLGNLSSIVIQPKGTAVLTLMNYEGLVHFKSRLPIGRPLIIVSDKTGFFDALHG